MPREKHERKPTADYYAEDAAMRAAWTTLDVAGADLDERAIERALGCSRADALLLYCLRITATAPLVSLWLRDRALTFRVFARIALLEGCGDDGRQLEAARRLSAVRIALDRACKASATPLEAPTGVRRAPDR